MKNLPLTIKIVIGIVVCVFVGFFSGYATSSSITDWYMTINKPFFNPPGWIFGPVWTVLYTMMGISIALIWHEGIERDEVKGALFLFGIQLILNFFWSIFFFGLNNPAIALVNILLLWATIAACIYVFAPIKKLASYLLYPYLAWVSFATILNFSIWCLN